MDLRKVKAHEKGVSVNGTGASVKISQRTLCLLLPCKDTTEVHCLHTGIRSSKALDFAGNHKSDLEICCPL